MHITGFALAGALYFLVGWRLGLALLIATGLLPWVAVVAANDRSPARAEHLTRNDSDARELQSDKHVTIDSMSCSSREWDLFSAPGDGDRFKGRPLTTAEGSAPRRRITAFRPVAKRIRN